MKNRQLPIDADETEFLNTINEIEALFDKNWFKKNPHLNPIKILWDRTDYLSSVELYLIGNAIKHSKNNIVWIEDFKKRIKGKFLGDIRGMCLEIYFASIIKDSELAPPSAKGFDILIKSDTEEIPNVRLSIKKLISSEKENNYRKEFDLLEYKFKQIMQTNKLNGYSLILLANKYSFEKTLQAIKEIPNNIKNNIFNPYNENIDIFINKIPYDNNLKLNPKNPTYQFNLCLPQHKTEHKRFIDKVKEATSKFKDVPPDNNNINTVLLGLPPSYSLLRAKQWLEREFEKGNFSKITYILLVKIVPAVDKKKQNVLVHDLCIVFNIRSHVEALKSHKLLRFDFPLGMLNIVNTSEQETSFYMQNEHGKKLDLSGSYNFQSICKHFVTDMKVGSFFNFDNHSIMKSCSITFVDQKKKSGMTASPNSYGKYDNLLVL